MKLLIDADFIVYKNCIAAEFDIDFGEDIILVGSRFSDAYYNVEQDLKRTVSVFLWDQPELVLFFSDSTNFRKELCPAYKGHRNRKKPCGYRRVINKLKENYEVIILPTLEADDSLGIYATKNPGNIICSPDKDMRQIPGWLYNFEETVMISEEEGMQWHFIQSLAGDQTDGYSGCPGYGIKTATKLFNTEGYKWETVVDAFTQKGLSEKEALLNARLAKILTKDDYDFKRRKPKFWVPTNAGSGTNNGTEFSDEKN
ncbi:MAG: T7 exonuclease [Chloroflexi bacterium]|nr:T7 exonuclease [Chloroflexota bacterium]|tara:strand:+ start:432 stop:1202 length:771 start_codon:yes stop_codon:yes gene_type:complete